MQQSGHAGGGFDSPTRYTFSIPCKGSLPRAFLICKHFFRDVFKALTTQPANLPNRPLLTANGLGAKIPQAAAGDIGSRGCRCGEVIVVIGDVLRLAQKGINAFVDTDQTQLHDIIAFDLAGIIIHLVMDISSVGKAVFEGLESLVQYTVDDGGVFIVVDDARRVLVIGYGPE